MLLRRAISERLVGRGPTPLFTAKRGLEYWGMGVTGRTQPYAQGEGLRQLDNMKHAVAQSSAAAASLTGNPNNVAYTSENIFSVEDYSAVERDHYQPLRGLTHHRIDPISPIDASTAHEVLLRCFGKDEAPAASSSTSAEGKNTDYSSSTLRGLWWGLMLKDFPSLRTPATNEFRTAWEVFFTEAAQMANESEKVKAMATVFLKQQREHHYICYAMCWRLTERLGDAVELLPEVSAHESRVCRLVLEQVMKLSLDTLADEPWAHQETTSPLNVDVSQFRAWHEAGFW